MARRLLVALLVCLVACRRGTTGPAPAASSSSAAEEAKAMVAAGDADGALARLQNESQTDGDVLFVQGLAWAHKAETAPLPAPGEPAGGAPPELKAEEANALAFFEKAVVARPELVAAHLAIADLLAPHVLRREAQERALAASRARATGRRREEPSPPKAVGSTLTVERVFQAYRRAAQADGANKPVVEAWIDFARKTGRLEEADAAFRELLSRDKENAAPFMRYGDFLASEMKDGPGAIAQYSQALIWQPNLQEAKARIADIYLSQAAAHYDLKEYATAQARLADARRYVTSPDTPEGARLRQLQTQLAQIRGR